LIRLSAIACLMTALTASAQSAELPPPPDAAQPQATTEIPMPSISGERAAMGDTAGGRYIPKPVLDILADPHFDPNVAYMLWQLSRRAVGDWTMAELNFVAQLAPTMLEAHLSVIKIQTLYVFWGLDPSDLFNISLAPNWQSQSTAFSTNDASNVASISAAECQIDVSEMTVSTFKACTSGRQF
jgi:hypothetical protein